MKSMGYSGGYKYPHNFSGHYVAEEYLPDALRGQRFYQPSESGEEAAIKERMEALRAPARAEDDAVAAALERMEASDEEDG
jgi:putative ATPase